MSAPRADIAPTLGAGGNTEPLNRLGCVGLEHVTEWLAIADKLGMPTAAGSEAWRIAIAEATATDLGEPPDGLLAATLRAFPGATVKEGPQIQD